MAGWTAAPPSCESGDHDPELLLRMLCHEFRTPVVALAALTRALADERGPLTPDDRRELAALARDQADHLQQVLRQVVAASTGALDPAAAPEPTVPLGRILPQVAALVPAERLRAGTTRRAGACPVPARRTRQVLLNLVQNALRHGPPDGVVGVFAALRGPGLTILVTDEGADPEPVVEALRRPAPGAGLSGLGLWIVRRLLAVDGGRVTARGLRPRGVGVEVVLPVTRPAGPPPAGGPVGG
ncbi:HAMP domain-containing sensor histidine kinase [Micromonospora sp. NPDC023956]|uniref:sensor histidine kinase n=1 Tax=Micromonospora sp. NPDC023956 TaxID=3155722 RepID=UPI003403FEFB